MTSNAEVWGVIFKSGVTGSQISQAKRTITVDPLRRSSTSPPTWRSTSR